MPSKFLAVAALIAGLAASSLPAVAAPFGPATGAISFVYSPTVALGAPNSTSTMNGNTFIFSTTGTLATYLPSGGSGTSAGTLTFSDTVGVTLPEVLPGFLTFGDNNSGSFVFDVASVTTASFLTSQNSTSFALYLLGTMGDSNLGLTPTPTSVTITVNSTGASAYSASATLSNPPSPVIVPEPATIAVLGIGLLGLGLARRRRS